MLEPNAIGSQPDPISAPRRPILLEPRRVVSTSEASLADRVLESLTEQLLGGTLVPGQWVSENEVAARLGVSRSPVREALRSLSREGLVEVRPRRGTIIAELSVEDAADIYRTRQLIYSEMARFAIENMTDDGVAELSAIIEEMRLSLDDSRLWSDCTRRWWQVLMDLCPSRSIQDIAAMLWRRSILFRGILLRMSEQRDEVLAYAERFIECARKKDAEGGHAATAALIGNARQRLLNQVFLQLDEDVTIQRPLSLSTRGAKPA